jgi:TonB-dependent receptor
MRGKSLLIILIGIFSFTTQQIFAQGKAAVYGTITEKSTGSTLPGATIFVKGTTIGTTTDPYGKFMLTGLPVGTDSLLFSYLGYQSQTVVITLAAGENKEINIEMFSSEIGLEEVVISGQLLGQAKAINQQLNSDALVNVVSENRIHELPDVNAAEAIGRISGVAIQRNAGEGQKIMLRGLSPKFTNITINGSRMASNSSTDKSVDLSMISPELLAGIEVYKSPTSDMDGEAVGGTVNLIIKKAPEKTNGSVKLDGGYNALNNSFANYKVAGNFSTRFFNNKLGIIVQANMEQVNRGNELLGTSSTTQDNELYYKDFRLSDIEEVRKRMGGSINVDYNIKGGNISLYTFYSKTKRDIFSQSERYSPREYSDIRYYSTEKNIDLDIFSTALRGDHKLGKLIVDWDLSTSITKNDMPLDNELVFRDINAYANTHIDNNNFNEWINDANKDFSESRMRESSASVNDVKENYYSGILNIKYPFNFGDKISGFIKGGGKYTVLDRTRDFNFDYEPKYYLGGKIVSDAVARYPNDMFYTTNGLIATKTFFNDYVPVDNTIFDKDYPFNLNFNRDFTHDWYNAQNDYYYHDRRKDVDDYTAYESIAAGYLMAKLNLGKKLTFIAGARIEASDNEYSGRYSTLSGSYGETGTVRDTTATQSYTDILPNFHMVYKPADWLMIKAAAVKTIARPNYNYVSPRTLIDINANTIKAGNPNLEHMEAWSYDLNVSLYSSKLGLLSVGGFYKDMKNIFYIVQNYFLASDSLAAAAGFSGYKNFYLTTYGNSPTASVYGFEIDLQTSLKSLPAPFNGVVLNANFTRIFSQSTKYWYTTHDTTYRDPVTGQIITESSVISKQREIDIPGQVPYIFNLSIGYDYKGFSGRVSGVFQGSYLKIPGTQQVEDVTSWKFWRWDATMSQKINKHLKVYLNLTNFNNQQEKSYKNNDINSPYRIQKYGMIVFLGLQARL